MLLRMIGNVNRWSHTRAVNRSNPTIWGDAIADLKTTKNTLSTWIANTDEQFEDAIVAIALGREKVDKIAYVLIDESDLKQLEIETSDDVIGSADGLDEELLKHHRDLIELDVAHLGSLAEHILKLSEDETRWDYVTEDEVNELLEKYKAAQKINVQIMNKKLKEKLNW